MSKVTLFLMGEKGLMVLQSLVNHRLTDQIGALVLGRDRQVINDFAEDIQELAVKAGMSLFERKPGYKIRTPYAIAISWRWMINYDSTKTKLITFHDSILPKYRGFAPLVNQLIQGEKEIGVTAFFATEEFDKGPIISIKKVSIAYPIKINQAIATISSCYQDLALEVVRLIRIGSVIGAKIQEEAGATYSLWRDEEDYRIDWQQSAVIIRRFIDAVGFPYLGASTLAGSRMIRIQEAVPVEDLHIVNRDIGKVLFMKDERPVVVCGKGLLLIKDACYDDDGSSFFPMSKFRMRFK